MNDIGYECPVCHITHKSDKEKTPFGTYSSVAHHIASLIIVNDHLHESWAYNNCPPETVDYLKEKAKKQNKNTILAKLFVSKVKDWHDNKAKITNIFELDFLYELIRNNNLDLILLVDTNTLMNYPDLKTWNNGVNSAVYVITQSIINELESLKKSNLLETKTKARNAISAITNLDKAGTISKGIQLKNIGWFISIAEPEESKIEPMLLEVNAIKKRFGRSDALFLLLTKEINQNIPEASTVFITGDRNLYNLFSSKGIKSHLMERFPFDATKYFTHEPVDFEKILLDIQTELEDDDQQII